MDPYIIIWLFYTNCCLSSYNIHLMDWYIYTLQTVKFKSCMASGSLCIWGHSDTFFNCWWRNIVIASQLGLHLKKLIDIYKSYAQLSMVMFHMWGHNVMGGKSENKGVKVTLKGDPLWDAPTWLCADDLHKLFFLFVVFWHNGARDKKTGSNIRHSRSFQYVRKKSFSLSLREDKGFSVIAKVLTS